MKKTTVTIGIPAFQSEQNIVPLLRSLLGQKTKRAKIEKILVYSDGSKDLTVKNARSVKSNKIYVFQSRKNHGYAYALQQLIKKSKSEIIIGLNDDIIINSNKVIEELIKPFIKNAKVGLVGGNIKALPPKTFIGKCIYTSYLIFEPLRYEFKKGESHLTCDGKVLALRKDLAKSLKLTNFPVGNVDIFLYYENLKQGRIYKFTKKAEVAYRLPETIRDFKNQESRATASRDLVKKQFSTLYKIHQKVPVFSYIKSAVKVFIKYPIETLYFKFIINKPEKINLGTNFKWKLALTTKKLGVILMDFGEHTRS